MGDVTTVTVTAGTAYLGAWCDVCQFSTLIVPIVGLAPSGVFLLAPYIHCRCRDDDD